jgi:hypothetical protein
VRSDNAGGVNITGEASETFVGNIKSKAFKLPVQQDAFEALLKARGELPLGFAFAKPDLFVTADVKLNNLDKGVTVGVDGVSFTEVK